MAAMLAVSNMQGGHFMTDEPEVVAVLCREIGETTWFDHSPLKPGSSTHNARERSPEWDTCNVYGEQSRAADKARIAELEQALIVPKEYRLVPVEVLRRVHRDLDACQKVIWLAGCQPRVLNGFDPAYVTEAQARLAEIDQWMEAQQQ